MDQRGRGSQPRRSRGVGARTLAIACVAIALGAGCTTAARAERAAGRATERAEQFAALDEAWLIEPYRTHDMAAYDTLVADDFYITHSNGRRLTKAEKRADILANTMVPRDPNGFRLLASRAQLHANGTVAVSRGAIFESTSNVYFTNTYVREAAGWRVVASQLTRGPKRDDAW